MCWRYGRCIMRSRAHSVAGDNWLQLADGEGEVRYVLGSALMRCGCRLPSCKSKPSWVPLECQRSLQRFVLPVRCSSAWV